MKITYYNDPDEHLIVENAYTSIEQKLIWQELDFLTDPKKLLKSSELTRSATDDNGIPLKQNYGVFLEEVYSDTHYSNILEITKNKIDHNLFNYFPKGLRDISKKANLVTTLLSYYESDDGYKPHTDQSVVTITSYFFREPKKFTGGELLLGDKNIEIKNNMMVIFFGHNTHGVSTIQMLNEQPFIGLGRYCISQFLFVVPSQFGNI